MSIFINSTEIEVPTPSIIMRERNDAVYSMMKENGETNLVSIIASNRVKDSSEKMYQDLLNPSLAQMPFWKLKDIDIAAKRIMEAKVNNEIIALVTDFDVDGICSAVVMKLALIEYMGFSEDQIQVNVNNRMLFGYGFNEKALDALFERAGDNLPTLVITADQGSNDKKTIRLYKEIMLARGYENASAIVTDHHHVKKDENCEDALAFINPQRPDDEFDDNTICGCVVALLTMSAAREYMIKHEVLPKDTPRLTPLLTYASLATVADCVSLQSGYNRCIIRRGLRDINQGLIPAWKVLKAKTKKPGELVTFYDMGFKLGPAINADSRTGGDGLDAISFLTAKTDADAEFYYERLNRRNERRKEIDIAMQEAAIKEASEQYYAGKRGLSLYLPSGIHGIHGIVASRVKERFGCPIIIFSPVDVKEKDHPDKIITGSGRSVELLSIIKVVQDRVEEKIEALGSGGHPMAMGMKIRLKDLPIFQEEFDRYMKEEAKEFSLDDDYFYPRVQVDHVFQEKELPMLNSTKILDQIKRLEPYGQRFEAPVFALNGTLEDSAAFGKGTNFNSHLKLFIRDSSGAVREAVVFFYEREPWVDDLAIGEKFTFAVTLQENSYVETGLGMIVKAICPGVNALGK